MDWKPLTDIAQLEQILRLSEEVPCLIFKHSTRCSISTIAKHRLESNWPFGQADLVPYFLDLIAFRNVSNAVADFFGVPHESPQIILLWKGEVLLDASHLDISVGEMEECLRSASVTTTSCG